MSAGHSSEAFFRTCRSLLQCLVELNRKRGGRIVRSDVWLVEGWMDGIEINEGLLICTKVEPFFVMYNYSFGVCVDRGRFVVFNI